MLTAVLYSAGHYIMLTAVLYSAGHYIMLTAEMLEVTAFLTVVWCRCLCRANCCRLLAAGA